MKMLPSNKGYAFAKYDEIFCDTFPAQSNSFSGSTTREKKKDYKRSKIAVSRMGFVSFNNSICFLPSKRIWVSVSVRGFQAIDNHPKRIMRNEFGMDSPVAASRNPG